MLLVFFFKQKTAYEMRISDWSSDVCSSDLASGRRDATPRSGHLFRPGAGEGPGNHRAAGRGTPADVHPRDRGAARSFEGGDLPGGVRAGRARLDRKSVV